MRILTYRCLFAAWCTIATSLVSTNAWHWTAGAGAVVATIGFVLRLVGTGSATVIVAASILAGVVGTIASWQDGIIRAGLVGGACFMTALACDSAGVMLEIWRKTRARGPAA